MLDGMGRCAWAQAVEGCAVSGTIIGIPTAKGPENGNGQVAQEEANRAQEEIKMNNQRHRSNEQIKRIKQDMEKMSDDQLRSILSRDRDRQLSALAHAELSARYNMPSVYEVTLLTAAMGVNVTSSRLKRTISSEYVESLLDVCDEVRIRKVEIE